MAPLSVTKVRLPLTRAFRGNFVILLAYLAGIGAVAWILETLPGLNHVLGIVLLGLALSVAYLVTCGFRLFRPFQEVVAAVRSFAQGNLDARIPPQTLAEFGELAETFNQSADVLVRRFRVEKLLSSAQKDLAHAATEEAVLQSVADYTCRIAVARLAVIFAPDPDGWLRPRARQGENLPYAEQLRIHAGDGIPEGHGLAATSFREGRTLCYRTGGPCPPETLPERWRAWQERAIPNGFEWVAVVPLRYNNRSLGILTFYPGPGDRPVALEAVETLALVAAAALHGLSLREETLLAMTATLEARDDETQAHARRVTMYTERLAWELAVNDPEELQFLRWGALLHDVGKIGLSDAVLRKPGSLTPLEWQEIRRHPAVGYELLRNLAFLGVSREIVLAHHERWNGSGYPRGLRGEGIPLGARIFAVADTFDAMTSDRPYRRAVSYRAARTELRRVAGTQLEPRLVHAFCQVPEEEWANLAQQSEAGFFSRFRSALSQPC